MENILKMLPETALFKGFTRDETISALLCLDGKVERYARKQLVYGGDKPLSSIGLVLSGVVYVSKEDEAGGQAIFSSASQGELFGETSLQDAAALHEVEGGGAHAFSVTAAEDCEILFVRTGKITQADRQGGICALRGRIIENLLALIVANNKGLYRKLDLISHRSLRSRIMHYLELQARRQRALSFAIPFSRADFADYLMVDRSALSRELCRMAADGLIAFSRNRFELLEREQ